MGAGAEASAGGAVENSEGGRIRLVRREASSGSDPSLMIERSASSSRSKLVMLCETGRIGASSPARSL
jgi:hypothetical protein